MIRSRYFTILLFAYARYGYASLRQLEEMSRYDLRCRWLLQGQTPSYKTYQRFINDQLKGTLEEISHQVYLCIQDQKALEAAILMIDGTKFEANANKMTFFLGCLGQTVSSASLAESDGNRKTVESLF